MARAFAARGAHLVVADLNMEAAEQVTAELRGQGVRVEDVHTDVTRRGSVEDLVAATYRRFGAAHILCNNAGVAVPGPLVEATAKDWQYVMGVNFWGVVHGVSEFVPRMLDGGEPGHVVNTASMSGLVGMRGMGVYCASKFAVVGLSESLARDLDGTNVGVSVLCPMVVDTPINENTELMRPDELRNEDEPPEQHASLVGGVISAEEVAARVVRGIERRDLYILTHPEQRPILRRRADRIDQAFLHWDL
jgi:NAD(P)-dependent dehydrogenase (short-subunit alcohol dehydrogenase family)